MKQLIAALAILLTALAADAQLMPGDPLPYLAPDELDAFTAGRALFDSKQPKAVYHNESNCRSCHAKRLNGIAVGGFGQDYNRALLFGYKPVLDVARDGLIGGDDFLQVSRMVLTLHVFDPLEAEGPPPGGPSLYKLKTLGGGPTQIVPPEANVISLRDVPGLLGLGLIEALPTRQIEAAAARSGGTVAYDDDGLALRFGTQGQMGATIPDAVVAAASSEFGIVPSDDDVAKLVAFLRGLAPAARKPDTPETLEGEQLFVAAGCESCHARGYLVAAQQIDPMSDFAFHDLGPLDDDGVALGPLRSTYWLTPPLWRQCSGQWMHDGNAATIFQMLARHGGEAKASADLALGWNEAERRAVEAFLCRGHWTAP